MNPLAYSQIPYAMEQGIFACLAGNFFAGAGNYRPRARNSTFETIFWTIIESQARSGCGVAGCWAATILFGSSQFYRLSRRSSSHVPIWVFPPHRLVVPALSFPSNREPSLCIAAGSRASIRGRISRNPSMQSVPTSSPCYTSFRAGTKAEELAAAERALLA